MSNSGGGVKIRDIHLALVCVLIFCFSLTALYIKYEPSLSDTAFFGGDTWEYQSIAVNVCLGHGYQFGNAETFETYRFDDNECTYFLDKDARPGGCRKVFDKGAYYSFYRTPGYPLFLALVYKVFGVHPRYAKIMQMVLLASSISVFPWIGRHYWSNLGILSGVVAALFVLYTYLLTAKPNYLDPTNILSEPLIVFGLSLWAVTSVFWEKKTTRTRTFFLGLASAVILLIKGITIFVPFLFIFYVILKFRKTSKTVELGLVFILGCSLLLIPWSVYASEKSGKIILLSTQFDDILLEGNNEDSINSGDWSYTWLTGNPQDYLYKRLEDSGYPATVKVLIFLSENKEDIPKLLKNKLLAAFSMYRTVISLMLAYYLMVLANRFVHVKNQWSETSGMKTARYWFLTEDFGHQSKTGGKSPDFYESRKFPIFPLIYLLNIFLITVIFFGYRRFVAPFIIFYTLPVAYLLLALLSHLILLLRTGGRTT